MPDQRRRPQRRPPVMGASPFRSAKPRGLAILEAAPSTSPDEHAWLRLLVPHLRAAYDRFAAEDKAPTAQVTHAETRAAAEKARIDSVVHPLRKPDTLDRLGDEILRLRAIVPAPADPPDAVAHVHEPHAQSLLDVELPRVDDGTTRLSARAPSAWTGRLG